MKIAIAQINTTVGDFAGNTAKILRWTRQAESDGAQLVIFPELTLTGYPPRDLLEKNSFIDTALLELRRLAQQTTECAVLVGYPDLNPHQFGKRLTNSAALLHKGQIASRHHKNLLPTYDVFDENRYFEGIRNPVLAEVNGVRFGVSICEDMWNPQETHSRPLYAHDPISELAALRPSFIVNLSASPYTIDKDLHRLKLLRLHCKRHSVPFFLCNLVGGNDELVFDGNSVALDEAGHVLAHAPAFEEGLITIEMGKTKPIPDWRMEEPMAVFKALSLGLQDYLSKCAFSGKIVLGLSGGIDSAVTAAIARYALGPQNVVGVLMPSKFSSPESITDSIELAKNLGIETRHIPIRETVTSYDSVLKEAFHGTTFGVAEENIQARIRGNILMALSNKFGWMVLSTGNKSELATGYCTLYGDMSGGLSLIADVPKTKIYALGRLINQLHGNVIPEAIFTKAPSAELRPNQTDQDSLPPYPILDRILKEYIEEMKSPAEIIAGGLDEATVRKTVALVDRNEYKRRQAAPCLRVTSKAFGSGRRMPIAHRWRE